MGLKASATHQCKSKHSLWFSQRFQNQIEHTMAIFMNKNRKLKIIVV